MNNFEQEIVDMNIYDDYNDFFDMEKDFNFDEMRDNLIDKRQDADYINNIGDIYDSGNDDL
jgi:hypothetical protein